MTIDLKEEDNLDVLNNAVVNVNASGERVARTVFYPRPFYGGFRRRGFGGFYGRRRFIRRRRRFGFYG